MMSLVYVDWARRKRMLKREAWLAIGLAYGLLVMAWIAPGSFRTSSSLAAAWTWAMMLVRVLYFHTGLLLLLIGVAAIWTRRYPMALCCLPLVLVTVVWPWMNWGTASITSEGPVLRTISANLLMVNQNTEPILDEIVAAGADVIFLQEYTEHWDKAVQDRLGQAYPYKVIYPQEDSFGAAIYSRHPFASKPVNDSSMGKWGVVQLSATIDFGGKAIDCWNIHLVPPRNWDYAIEHLDEMRDFEQRLRATSRAHVIVAGDFNFSGATLQASAIRSTGFKDAFEEAGAGRGNTWPVNGIFRYLPGIRLDHIYLSPGLRCRSIRTGTGSGSDHRPLIAEIELDL